MLASTVLPLVLKILVVNWLQHVAVRVRVQVVVVMRFGYIGHLATVVILMVVVRLARWVIAVKLLAVRLRSLLMVFGAEAATSAWSSSLRFTVIGALGTIFI